MQPIHQDLTHRVLLVLLVPVVAAGLEPQEPLVVLTELAHLVMAPLGALVVLLVAAPLELALQQENMEISPVLILLDRAQGQIQAILAKQDPQVVVPVQQVVMDQQQAVLAQLRAVAPQVLQAQVPQAALVLMVPQVLQAQPPAVLVAMVPQAMQVLQGEIQQEQVTQAALVLTQAQVPLVLQAQVPLVLQAQVPQAQVPQAALVLMVPALVVMANQVLQEVLVALDPLELHKVVHGLRRIEA